MPQMGAWQHLNTCSMCCGPSFFLASRITYTDALSLFGPLNPKPKDLGAKIWGCHKGCHCWFKTKNGRETDGLIGCSIQTHNHSHWQTNGSYAEFERFPTGHSSRKPIPILNPKMICKWTLKIHTTRPQSSWAQMGFQVWSAHVMH